VLHRSGVPARLHPSKVTSIGALRKQKGVPL
jgi:hypothetical protein